MPLTYQDIKEPFLESLRNDKRATALIKEIEAGRGTYEMASEYAARVGDNLAKVLKQRAPLESIAEWDIEDLIPKSLGLDHSMVVYACENVQTALNKDAGLRIPAGQLFAKRRRRRDKGQRQSYKQRGNPYLRCKSNRGGRVPLV